VFQVLGSQAGLVFLLPVYMYLFVVALGTDYNILMIARLREQARERMEPRQSAAVAFRHAGPTIGAAGLILAGTFASLTPARNTILAQLGFGHELPDDPIRDRGQLGADRQGRLNAVQRIVGRSSADGSGHFAQIHGLHSRQIKVVCRARQP
jgi:MMPL family